MSNDGGQIGGQKIEHFCPPKYTIRHFIMYITNVQLHVFQHIP